MMKALVTGGNRGIGFEIAKGLKAKGLDVIIGARDIAAGKAAAQQIGTKAIELDVASPKSIRAAVQEIGAVEVLVNNAGVLGTGKVLDDPEEFALSMDVMLHGPYLMMHHLTPHMIQQGYGRVVNVSSGWGAYSDGMEGPASYGVAKAALNALTFASAQTLPNAVKVNAMCPGWVRTRMGGAEADRSPQEGADTAIWLATLTPDGPTGGFFRDRERIDW